MSNNPTPSGDPAQAKPHSATNGSGPAFAEPLHVGRPNVGDRHLFTSLTNEMFDSQWLTNDGPLVKRFENAVADHLGVKHCIATNNGTLALEIAIRALGLSGEVIVPSYTFIATAHALQWQGITPVFADIDPDTHNLDPASVRERITPRTSGIIGVHLWGRPAPVDELQAIASEHELALMFDAAHAFGCTRGGTSIGTFGRAEVLSFHATKFLNCFEGGAVVTQDDDLAENLRLIRNFGFSGYDNVVALGTNAKLTEVCAAMGLANLEDIDRFVEVNRRNYEAYRDIFAAIPGLSMLEFDMREACNYQYVVIEVGSDCKISRDELVAALHSENILVRRYFWPGCHRMEPYKHTMPYAGDGLPNTEAVADRVVVFPTGTSVSAEAIKQIGQVLVRLT
jgi:dTDP-4-amino-4,6-dideoxygalactose transaminase